jgi:hypothetical protein
MPQKVTPTYPPSELSSVREAYVRGELALASAQAVEAYLHHDTSQGGQRPDAAATPRHRAAWRVAGLLLGLGISGALASWLLSNAPAQPAAATITKLVPSARHQLLAEAPAPAATSLGADTTSHVSWPQQP